MSEYIVWLGFAIGCFVLYFCATFVLNLLFLEMMDDVSLEDVFMRAYIVGCVLFIMLAIYTADKTNFLPHNNTVIETEVEHD